MCTYVVDKFFYINSSKLGWAQNIPPTHSSTLKTKLLKTLVRCAWKSRPRPPYPLHACMQLCTFTSALRTRLLI